MGPGVTAYWARVEWRRRGLALLGLALVAGLAGGGAVTLAAGAKRSANAWDRLAAITVASDALVFSFEGVNPAQREQLSEIEGVEEVVPLIALAVVPEGSGLQPFFGAAGFASPDPRILSTLEAGVVLDGRRADPDVVDEVAINPEMAEQQGLAPGDTIRLASLSPAQLRNLPAAGPDRLEGPSPEVHVVGVLEIASDYAESSPDASIYFTSAFHDRYAERIGRLDLAFVLLEPGADQQAFETAAVAAFGGDPGFDITTLDESSDRTRVSLDFLAQVLLVVALVTALVGATIVTQLVARQLRSAEGDRQVLRGLGTTRRGWARLVLAAVLPAAVVAGAVTVVVAWLGSPLTSIGNADQIGLDRGRSLDGPTTVIGVLATVVIVVVAALVASARPAAERDGRADGTRLGRLLRPLPLVPQLGGRFAFGRGGTARRAVPFTALACAGIVTGLVIGGSLQHLDRHPELYGFSWDTEIGLIEVDLEDLERDPGIEALARFRDASVEIAGTQVPAIGVEPVRGRLTPSIREGTAPASATEVALGARTRRHLGVGIGDEVEVTGVLGTERFVVVGEVVFPSSDTESPDDGVALSLDGLDRIQPPPEDDDVPIGALVRFGDGAEGEASRARLGELLTYIDAPDPPAEVVDLVDLGLLVRPVVAFFALLGGAAALHGLLMSTRERRRALGVLRAIGLRRGQVRGVILWDQLTILVLALAIGLPIGIVAGRTAWRAIADRSGLVVETAVPAGGALLVGAVGFALAMLFAAGVAWASLRRSPGAVLREG